MEGIVNRLIDRGIEKRDKIKRQKKTREVSREKREGRDSEEGR